MNWLIRESSINSEIRVVAAMEIPADKRPLFQNAFAEFQTKHMAEYVQLENQIEEYNEIIDAIKAAPDYKKKVELIHSDAVWSLMPHRLIETVLAPVVKENAWDMTTATQFVGFLFQQLGVQSIPAEAMA